VQTGSFRLSTTLVLQLHFLFQPSLMGTHRQILLKNIREPDQHTLAGYESRSGYKAIRKALGMDPQKIIEQVKASGLRGRGGAGFSTGTKWSFIPKNSQKPVYIINNADESEPGTFKDRLLLERDPHATIEGMLIAAWAVQSNWSCIYIRGEYAFPYERLVRAVRECYAKGYLGKNIFGSNFNHTMVIHRGAGAYICGEETGLIESLEGKKGQPRLKPPFYPASIGVYDSPTIVNNVETFAAVPYIIREGAEAYASIGTEQSKGTKLISASGHINNPGVYEIELGYPLEQFLEEECGGIWKGNKLKGVIPGGSSVPVLRADEIAGVNLSYESLNKAGTFLGSGGFFAFDHTTDVVDSICNLMHFYAHESCGQCTPCREGGHWIEKIFNRIRVGSGTPGDLELVDQLCRQIANGRTICTFGDAIAMPAQSFIKKFREEFETRVRAGMKRGLRSLTTVSADAH
jgi:NADH-quinone oxidoreductase subunit F